jgi:hypothetical protein
MLRIKLYEEFISEDLDNFVIGNLKTEFEGIKPENSVLVSALDYTTGSEDSLIKVKFNDQVYNIPKNQVYIDASMSI